MKLLPKGKSTTYLVLRKGNRLGNYFWVQNNKINKLSSTLILHKHLKREDKWTTHTVAYEYRGISSFSVTLLTNSGKCFFVHRLPTQRQLHSDRLHGLVFQWGCRARKMSSCHLGQVHAISFSSNFSLPLGSDKSVCQLNYYNSKLRLCPGQAKY